MPDILNFSVVQTQDLAVAVNPASFSVGASNTTIVAPNARCANGLDRYAVAGKIVQSQDQSQVIKDLTGANSLLVVFDVRKVDGTALAILTEARKLDILQRILTDIVNSVSGL